MRVVRRSKSPEAFAGTACTEVAEGLYPLHFSDLGRSYYAGVAQEKFNDKSFLVEDGGRIVALVECDISGSALGRFQSRLEIRFRPDAPYHIRKIAMRQIMAEFALLRAQANVERIDIATAPKTDPDGLAATALLSSGAVPVPVFVTEIDLSLSEKAIIDDYRSGHRQQMKWGEKNLALRFADADNPDHDLFNRYREFHAHVAGRQTRGDASWDAMFHFIKAGEGDIVFGFLGEDLVSATVVLDANGRSVYASGVYDRSRFDLPLSHFALTTAILRARRRGARTFEIGQVFVPQEDTKAAAIGYFKRGFSSRLTVHYIWNIPGEIHAPVPAWP